MLNLIPYYIHNKFKKNDSQGEFIAITMFMDIAGFTPMTEKLMRHGKEGAEVLSVILNNIFKPVIDTVYDRGGYISGFAGDAFTAIFPSIDYPLKPLLSAISINKIFKNKEIQKTRLGDFKLSVKIGLSYGNTEWGILGNKKHKTYYFKGEAVYKCTEAEKQCNSGNIILDNSLYKIIPTDICNTKKINNNYYLLKEITIKEKELHVPSLQYTMEKSTVKNFFSKKLLSQRLTGEFRDIVSIFISFPEFHNFKRLNFYISEIIQTSDDFGGYFNALAFEDKCPYIVILFGAPISYEDNIERAVKFILSIKDRNKIKAGLTFGRIYTGMVGSDKRCEYTALGDDINLASRFMMKADWEHIWICKKLAKRINEKYKVKKVGEILFKGRSEREQVFELIEGKENCKNLLFEGQMIGREHEFRKLEKYTKPIFNRKFGGIVYIYGEPGIGKSRLLYEFTEYLKLNNDVNICTLQTDSILRKTLNPFIYFFDNYFKMSNLKSTEEKIKQYKKIYRTFISSVKKISDKKKAGTIINELYRIESIIASIIGIHWEGSIYGSIPNQEKPIAIRFAIKEFFKALSIIKPIVLIIEDLHWIDDESKNVYELFTRDIENCQLIIITTSRYNDDGTKPKFKDEKNILQKEIVIKRLSTDLLGAFIKNQLKGKASKKLILFISSKTQNIPFYIEQLCLYLKENQLLELEENRYTIISENIEIPTGINAILISRIDRLSDELIEAAQIASVLGKEFEIQTLYELIKLIIKEISSKGKNITEMKIFKHILSDGINERIWNVLSDVKYIFRHALFRDAIYQMQLKERIRNLHRLTGECLEHKYKGDENKYVNIAYHYDKAEIFIKAKEYYEKAGDYSKENYKLSLALEYYNKCKTICLKRLGEKHPDTAISFNNIGEVYHERGEYDKALDYFNKATAIREKIFGKDHPDTAMLYNLTGTVYWNKGDNKRALKYYIKALNIREEKLGENHLDTTKSYNNLGLIYRSKGDYEKALEYFNKSIIIREETLGLKHPNTANSYINIGLVYRERGDYEKALEYYKKSLIIFKETLGKKHPNIALIYNNIGIICRKKGDNKSALEYYNKSIDINKETLGDIHPEIARIYNNIGAVYWNKGDLKRASESFEKALSIQIEILGEKHPDTANSYNNIGEVYMEKGNYKKTLIYYKKALDIFKEILGEKHPDIAESRQNIGNVYKEIGKFKKAYNFYNKALKIYKEIKNNKKITEIKEKIKKLDKV